MTSELFFIDSSVNFFPPGDLQKLGFLKLMYAEFNLQMQQNSD